MQTGDRYGTGYQLSHLTFFAHRVYARTSNQSYRRCTQLRLPEAQHKLLWAPTYTWKSMQLSIDSKFGGKAYWCIDEKASEWKIYRISQSCKVGQAAVMEKTLGRTVQYTYTQHEADSYLASEVYIQQLFFDIRARVSRWALDKHVVHAVSK